MKTHPALNWLVPAITVLAIIATSMGLFWQNSGSPFTFTTLHSESVQMYGQGIYQNDTYFKAPIFRGTDFVALFVCMPLLIVSFWRYRQGSLRGRLLMLGVLAFFLYDGISLAFSAAFNSLFLVYTALFSASFLALVYALTEIDLAVLLAHISPGVPRRGIASFMFAAGLGTGFIWLSEIVGSLAQGQLPVEALGPYTTLVTHALDIGIIAPVAILTGVYLLRRAPVGYLLAAPMLVLCSLVGAVVISQTIFQTMAGITLPIALYIGMVGSWIVMGTWAVWLVVAFLRCVGETAVSLIKPSPASAT
jgi:hypothetical protein